SLRRGAGKSRAAPDPDRRLPRRGGARGLLPDASQSRRSRRGRRGGHDARAGRNKYWRTGARPRSRGRNRAEHFRSGRTRAGRRPRQAQDHSCNYRGVAAQALNLFCARYISARKVRAQASEIDAGRGKDMKTVAVIGTQWGDEGKGKIVDMLAADADVVVRFQGGNNAAHTLVVGGKKFVLRLVPAGALHPGKACVIGNGLVVNPLALLGEIADLKRSGHLADDSLLKISYEAHMVMPYHLAIDRAREA